MPRRTLANQADEIADVAQKGQGLSVEEIRKLLNDLRKVYREGMVDSGFDPDGVGKLAAKFRDAGRRSAPWRAFSGRIAGRPQDGADGNRINRWLLPPDHKYYADEETATLVEVKYFLQALSMDGAPDLGTDVLTAGFHPWLIENEVRPGAYIEPIQLVPIDLAEIVLDRRRITSGHLVPLDRSGRHEPRNTFLIYSRSNQLQGNMTLNELLSLAHTLTEKHRENGTFPTSLEMPPEGVIHGAESAIES